MNTLRSLQQEFVAAVFDNRDNNVDELLTRTPISGKRRLRIYRNNIYTSLTEALSAVYPVINRLGGDEFFTFMADAYIRRYPSHSGNLHDFGAELALFIETFDPANSLVYLPDIARLEWAYHSVFHAAESPRFDSEKLQQIDPEKYSDLVFTTNPASQLIHSPYPVLTIWQANQETSSGNTGEQDSSETIDLDEGESRLLLIRKELDIEIHNLATDEFAFLQAIYQRNPFFAACDAATQINPRCDISQCLLKHIQNQTIIDCEIPAD